MEQTLYRKYRSDNFEELAGQEHIKKLFKISLSEEKFSNAYIFAGPRGTGKTTVARIVAKRLNCLNPKGFEPCNECEQCKAIKNGSHLDVIEMDAASNRGIDDFRAIRDKVAYKPAQGKYKIYIIDEVHMLTNEAFNAILKTLEEPPEHAVFILATTNPEKIPDTIISRCQIIPFRNMTLKTIQDHIAKISELEGYDIEEDVLKYVSKRAKGGMRDAMVLLEQIMRFLPKDKEIKKKDVLEVLGGVDEERYDHFVSIVKQKDFESIIDFSDSIYNNGINFEVFLEGLTEHILETLFKLETSEQKKIHLKIAKKASDMTKEIRYSETPNILFTVEFIDFAEKYSRQEINNLSMEKSVVYKEKEFRTTDREYTGEEAVRVSEAPTKMKTENTLENFEIDEDKFSILFNTNIDLYVALSVLENEEVDGILKIWKDSEKPFSTTVIERKEGELREFLKKLSLTLEIISDETVNENKFEEKNMIKEVDEIPPELTGLYNKVKNLFPESKITITENDTE